MIHTTTHQGVTLRSGESINLSTMIVTTPGLPTVPDMINSNDLHALHAAMIADESIPCPHTSTPVRCHFCDDPAHFGLCNT